MALNIDVILGGYSVAATIYRHGVQENSLCSFCREIYGVEVNLQSTECENAVRSIIPTPNIPSSNSTHAVFKIHPQPKNQQTRQCILVDPIRHRIQVGHRMSNRDIGC